MILAIITRMTRAHFPLVSFIIPTLNAAAILPKCLQAIRGQRYPQNKIEIIVADAGSTDNTRKIARSFGAKIIPNPEILHEPGKDSASKIARGEILFFTDADNILSSHQWLNSMMKAYRQHPKIMGFLPQTLPARGSNSLDRYLGYLSTDPLTWFIYGPAAHPRDYAKMYQPIKETSSYKLYTFTTQNHPLIGLTQGFGTKKTFKRGTIGHADDILAAIKLISEGGIIAYVPAAGVYHYHVAGLENFIKKYRWRFRNNVQQKIKGMGLVNRLTYLNSRRRMRMYLFIPYALSVIFPALHALQLTIKHRDPVMLWHVVASWILAVLILYESLLWFLVRKFPMGDYE